MATQNDDLIQIRRDTAANWVSANPVLANGEMAIESDTNKYKNGDGSSDWNTLAYVATGANGSDGSTGATGDGFTGGSYDAGTGIVTFTSDDGLGFATDDLRGEADSVTNAAVNTAIEDDAAASRTSLGLGDAATKDTGTSSGEVAAGDDSRFDTTALSALSAATALDGTELILLEQGGNPVQEDIDTVLARAATVDLITAVTGADRDKYRSFSHLTETPTTYSATTGQMFGNSKAYAVFSGTAADVRQLAAFRLGLAQCRTGTTSSGAAGIFDSFQQFIFTAGTSKFDFGMVAKVGTLPDATDDYTIQVGLMSSTSAFATSGLFFRLNHSSGNWDAVASDSGSATLDQNVLVADTSFHTFRVAFDVATGEANFYVDGVITSGSPVTTDIPTAIIGAAIGGVIFKTVGGNDRDLQVDAYTLEFTDPNGDIADL